MSTAEKTKPNNSTLTGFSCKSDIRSILTQAHNFDLQTEVRP